MALSFEVQRMRSLRATERIPETLDFVKCRVLDDDYMGIDVAFEYLVITSEDDPREVGLHATRIGQAGTRAGRPAIKRFTISIIRDLPLARWEQAARGVVTWAIDDLNKVKDVPGEATTLTVEPRHSTPLSREGLVDDLVKKISSSPNVDSPAGRRRRESLRKLANVAVDYRNELMHGRPDPAVAIASKYDVSPSTARSWIHRARAAGFLAPAVGRMPGEQLAHTDIDDDIQAGFARGLAALIPTAPADGEPGLDEKIAAITRERDEARTQLHELGIQVQQLQDALSDAARAATASGAPQR